MHILVESVNINAYTTENNTENALYHGKLLTEMDISLSMLYLRQFVIAVLSFAGFQDSKGRNGGEREREEENRQEE